MGLSSQTSFSAIPRSDGVISNRRSAKRQFLRCIQGNFSFDIKESFFGIYETFLVFSPSSFFLPYRERDRTKIGLFSRKEPIAGHQLGEFCVRIIASLPISLLRK